MCGMMPLKTELHCHNIFSNGHVGALEPIYDCNVTIPKQLEQAYLVGLDVLFVTNHNTIDGYRQMLEYKKIIRNLIHYACIQQKKLQQIMNHMY